MAPIDNEKADWYSWKYSSRKLLMHMSTNWSYYVYVVCNIALRDAYTYNISQNMCGFVEYIPEIKMIRKSLVNVSTSWEFLDTNGMLALGE